MSPLKSSSSHLPSRLWARSRGLLMFTTLLLACSDSDTGGAGGAGGKGGKAGASAAGKAGAVAGSGGSAGTTSGGSAGTNVGGGGSAGTSVGGAAGGGTAGTGDLPDANIPPGPDDGGVTDAGGLIDAAPVVCDDDNPGTPTGDAAAEPTGLLAYDPFGVPPQPDGGAVAPQDAGSADGGTGDGGVPGPAAPSAPLNSWESGFGWKAAWEVQNGNREGYAVTNASPLTVAGLLSTPGYAVGGNAYLGSGRPLDTSAGGPFSRYLKKTGGIGRIGTTLWVSALLRLDAKGKNDTAIYLHNSNASWWRDDPNGPPKVGIGTFEQTASPENVQTWAVRVLDTSVAGGLPPFRLYDTKVVATPGKATLLVASITFACNGGTVNLYVNPPGGANPPAAPSVTATGVGDLWFKALAFYPGNDKNTGSVDEIRLGTSFAAVTPAP